MHSQHTDDQPTAPVASREPALAMDFMVLDPNVIQVGPRWRQGLDREGLEQLKGSIRRIGVKVPISVRRVGHEWHLVAGANRRDACLQLGLTEIPAREEHGTETDALMWEIAENLHRIELTSLEHDKHVAKWIELCNERDAEKKVSLQDATKLPQSDVGQGAGGGRPETGINAAARELGVEKTDAHRAVKVAGLTDEAQQEAVNLGLDDNRSALLKAAGHEGSDAQVQALRDKAAAKAEAKARPKPPRKASAEPREPAAQARSKAISGFCRILHQQPTETLADLTRVLWDERSQIAQITRPKRLELARGYLNALGISVDDLQPGADQAA